MYKHFENQSNLFILELKNRPTAKNELILHNYYIK